MRADNPGERVPKHAHPGHRLLPGSDEGGGTARAWPGAALSHGEGEQAAEVNRLFTYNIFYTSKCKHYLS